MFIFSDVTQLPKAFIFMVTEIHQMNLINAGVDEGEKLKKEKGNKRNIYL